MGSFVVSAKAGKDFLPHPAGVYAARCTRIIDIGSQDTEWKGKKKTSHKMVIGFQTEALIEEGDRAGENFLLTQRYTASLGEKSALRRDLESWRGRKFTPQEIEGFDLRNILGKACLLNVVHATGDSRVYANIQGIMPLPPSMTAPQGEKPILFSLQDFDQSVFDSLSEHMQEVIARSPEYQALKGAKAAPKATKNGGAFDDMDEDIPF